MKKVLSNEKKTRENGKKNLKKDLPAPASREFFVYIVK